MKVYVAAMIDKSLRSSNAKLQKQLAAELRKSLKTPRSAITTKELNTFIFLSGKKRLKEPFDPKVIEKIEKEGPHNLFAKYYGSNKSKMQKELRKKQELRETSEIVKDFIEAIDSGIAKTFEANLKKISEELPSKCCEIQSRSYVALWDFEESHEYRFALSGFAHPFTGNSSELQKNLADIVDKVVMLNFFKAFLEPTTTRLREMNSVLEKLKLGVQGKHYKTQDKKLQEQLMA